MHTGGLVQTLKGMRNAPLPPAKAETPSAMQSQEARRSARAPSVAGMRSPSASRPTSTPVQATIKL